MNQSAKMLHRQLKDLLEIQSSNQIQPTTGIAQASEGPKSWLNRSLTDLLKSDVDDSISYHSLLKVARRKSLPQLKKNLNKNLYADIILDLVCQQIEELEQIGPVEVLYLLEMALELSQVETGNAVHVHLLNMIFLHRDKYGSLDLLRQEELPEDKSNRERFEELDALANTPPRKRSLPEIDIESTLDETAVGALEMINKVVKKHIEDGLLACPHFEHIQKSDNLTDSQILATELMLEQVNQEALEEESRKISEMDAKTAERKARGAVVRHWRALEDKIKLKVSAMVNDPEQVKQLKRALWERQSMAEQVLDFTERVNHASEMVESFHKEMLEVRPVFRAEMGKKISSKPEVAEKIYNILDTLAEQEVSAFDYLGVAIALAKTPHDDIIHHLENTILANETVPEPDDIVMTIDSFVPIARGIPDNLPY